MGLVTSDYVHLLRLSLEGKAQDVVALARKNLKKISIEDPEGAEIIRRTLAKYDGERSISRDYKHQALPIDIDSKLELLKREEITQLDIEPVWTNDVVKELTAVIEERNFEKELIEKGLSPTKSILFVGPPGVGKTLAARWISSKLKRPLLTLDLAAVMSSYLGKTGNNIRAVLNYAQKTPSILLLDEFDSIAKKRDDDSEVGELKRLVTVLLQAVDEWPSSGVLIAATNHPELLDPAMWRRFERVVSFPTPNPDEIKITMTRLFDSLNSEEEHLIDALSIILEGVSYAEIARQINMVRKESIVSSTPVTELLKNLLINSSKDISRDKKINVSKKLLESGLSQRKISEMIGISRDTLRKYR